MNYKQIGILMGVAFGLFFLAIQPTEAADFMRQGLGGIGDAAAKLAEFIRRLVH